MNRLEEFSTSGGDTRLARDENGRNPYWIDPTHMVRTLNRGSCTCSPYTVNGADAAHRLLDRIDRGEVDAEEVRERHRERLLAGWRQAGTDADIIFAPSGSDLCYLPLLMSQVLWPGRRIVNIVACSEELGSGSLLAHQGRFFSSESQIAERLPLGETVSAELDIDYHPLAARGVDGSIIDQSREIERLIEKNRSSATVVVNLVIGSKSGIENSASIIHGYRDENIIWTVDLCQFRNAQSLTDELLSANCLLFVTGSKFYQAPPFCGAMIVPGSWVRRVASRPVTDAAGFDRLFSRLDFPVALANLRAILPTTENVGLSLRWEAALDEMSRLREVGESAAVATIDAWNDAVVTALQASTVCELLSDQELTNSSIVSFRMRVGDHYLDRDALARVHRTIATEVHPELPAYDRVLIGQPVSYAEGSFLRVALGAADVHRFAAQGMDVEDDVNLVRVIERAGAGCS